MRCPTLVLTVLACLAASSAAAPGAAPTTTGGRGERAPEEAEPVIGLPGGARPTAPGR